MPSSFAEEKVQFGGQSAFHQEVLSRGLPVFPCRPVLLQTHHPYSVCKHGTDLYNISPLGYTLNQWGISKGCRMRGVTSTPHNIALTSTQLSLALLTAQLSLALLTAQLSLALTHSTALTSTPHSTALTSTPHSTALTSTPHSTALTSTPHSTALLTV